MCGICGFVGEGNVELLHDMMSRLYHRGPDAGGHYVDPKSPVFLGHRRLSILDIGGGHQPMWNEDDQVGVVFNGEIYNHQSLRHDLEDRGHIFQTDHSDTEVLVHGYEEWGSELPLRLHGMFAFAILDRRTRSVFLARDRFGKKPLYYSHGDHHFVFASELSALGVHPRVDTQFDLRALKKYFAYGFLPEPNALWRGARKLSPGGRLHYNLSTGDVLVDRYWTFRIEPSAELSRASEQELSEELIRLLEQGVRRRLVSDVPLGIFLSGGIDSTAVLALAARHLSTKTIKTFSIGFLEKSFDESSYAREVAREFGTDHHEQILDMSNARELLQSVLGRLDEPLSDPSILPTYLLNQFARQKITVALGGDGGDEIFGGYDPFKALTLARLYSAVMPRLLHGGLRRLVDLLPNSTKNMSLDFKLRRTLRGLSYPSPYWNSIWLGPLEPADFDDFLQEPVDPADVYSEALEVWEESHTKGLVDRSLEFYTRLYLPSDILVKADRASMLNSLEVRSPFLDYDLVDFARRLPFRFKVRRGATKYILKRALEGVIPDAVIKRKKKGFGIPLAAWLQEWPDLSIRRSIATLAPDLWPNTDANWIHQQWQQHRRGKKDQRYFLWSWLALMHHEKPQPKSRSIAA